MSAIDEAMGSDYGVGTMTKVMSRIKGEKTYHIYHMKELRFMPTTRRIATHLTLQEAEAMCKLLNAGGDDG